MRWQPGSRSADIEDRRGASVGGGFGGFGGMRMGLGGFLLLLVLSFVFKKNFFALLGGGDAGSPSAGVTQNAPPAQSSPQEEKAADFTSFVLDDVQKTWDTVLPQSGVQYQHAKLVLFRDAVRSGCGVAEAAMGPFYCPTDGKVYIDLGFYDQLRARFGAPGDFAQAYVIAHEIGHRVQDVLGIAERVHRAQESNPNAANELSVRMELQADCLAGVWAHSTAQRDILEKGDVEEGLAAAAAVGDDRIQRGATGRVHPESFTHGTSAQRSEWFRRGLQSGKVNSCDTFGRG